MSGQGSKVLARRPLKITAATATITAVDEITAGAPVEISWTGPSNRGDSLTIAPKGSPDNRAGASASTQSGSPLRITAPIEVGEFEIRYIMAQGTRVLARRPLRTITTEVTLSAPDEAIAGSQVSITWKGPGNYGDVITIVPRATPDGRLAANTNTHVGPTLSVAAPVEAGDCEIRYVTGQGSKVLARRPLKVLGAEATLSAVDEIVAGAPVQIAWTGPNNRSDYLTIAPKGSPDNRPGASTGTQVGSPLKINAPIEVGEFEIRYVTGQGAKVLARRPLRTIAAEVTLDAQDEVIAGSQVSVAWKGPNNAGDFITIVPRTTPDGRNARYTNTQSGSPLKVIAPIDAGDAEIRYMSGQGAKVLARRALRIVEAKITLSAPAKATAGTTVAIEWTGPDNPGDFITIVPKGTNDATSGRYVNTQSGSPARVMLPAAAGACEIRYVNGSSNRVLARIGIEGTAP